MTPNQNEFVVKKNKQFFLHFLSKNLTGKSLSKADNNEGCKCFDQRLSQSTKSIKKWTLVGFAIPVSNSNDKPACFDGHSLCQVSTKDSSTLISRIFHSNKGFKIILPRIQITGGDRY